MYQEKLAATITKRLERRNFDVIVCQNRQEAKQKALTLIPAEKTVAFGGSMTLVEMDLISALEERQQPVINREKAKDLTERHQLMKQSLLADYYLTSVNGISEEGMLVNIDNVGNRVAAMTYGPDKVFVFAGINKIYGDLETTLAIVRGKTAPQNSFRLNLQQTPCVKTGLCGDCLKEECICNIVSVMRRSALPKRITIFLILEELGI
ncbi:L-lactate utilization protein LutB [Enterococcus sp. PF1-24]|uniref:lactate utilization protein n=1 Tax=unclassified Enterococcus TaxID=2608891 RepID=UPI0024737645|nr:MULTISPECIES: lactate utilization protein [unclassified Enterococcus]MDH6365816.1 L-lactate utilization protein LutB [Enterococcus sp. PFB1-1]MDH6402916.1 L-lactate utilization protein LutB [Enterococcus sp. PF1-24]